jgi:hypothetical protein
VAQPAVMGVTVEVGDTGFRLTDPVVDRALAPGRRLVADATRTILQVDGFATFDVADGARIRVKLEPGISLDALFPWLHSSVAALLLAQRGRFALHASVVDVGGMAVAVAGHPAAGKSTTAARLAQFGHSLVTDDVSPLDVGDPVTVHPFSRPLYVSPQTAASLGLDVSRATPNGSQTKLAFSVPAGNPIPLGAIAALHAHDTATGVDAVRLRGADAHALASRNIFCSALLQGLWDREMFAWAADVASRVPVYAVRRPANGWTVDAVAHAVERVGKR